MLPILVDYEIKLAQVIQDEDNELDDPGRQAYIDEAVKGYSFYRPQIYAKSYTGNNGYDYSLPDDWEEGFSTIKAIEYPAEEQEPVFLDTIKYTIYQGTTGKKIRFLEATPGTTETFILLYTIRHTVEEDAGTIPEADFDAVVNLAGALACWAIGRKFVQSAGGATIAVSDSTWRSVIQYTEKGKELMELFLKHVGVDKDVAPAFITRSMPSIPSWGKGWLTNR